MSGAILSKNEMIAQNVQYTDAAYDSVQNQRHVHPVPVMPMGTIHDYVPFYFNSLSPMLYAIKCGNVPGVNLQDIIFFQSTAHTVEVAGAPFVFTDGHAIMALTDFYNDLADLGELPWEIIHAQYWNDYLDGKRLRQSEFLVYKHFSWNLVERIGVYNQNMQNYVQSMLQNALYIPAVDVKPNWYF